MPMPAQTRHRIRQAETQAAHLVRVYATVLTGVASVTICVMRSFLENMPAIKNSMAAMSSMATDPIYAPKLHWEKGAV